MVQFEIKPQVISLSPSLFMKTYYFLKIKAMESEKKWVSYQWSDVSQKPHCSLHHSISIPIYGQSGPDRAMTHLRDAAETRHPEGPRR